MKKMVILLLTLSSLIFASSSSTKKETAMEETKAYLQITLNIKSSNRNTAVGVYKKYKQPFLSQIQGAQSKELVIRTQDVQVLHGFDSVENAQAYLKSNIFANDVVRELSPLLENDPEIRIYSVF